MPILDLKCLNCDISFSRNLSAKDLSANRGVYCSRKCHYTHKRRTVEKFCLFCSEKFICHPATIRIGGGKYCSHSCRGKDKSGEKSSSFKNGIYINSQGYIAYSRKDGKKSVLQHRYFIEQHLGRKLLPYEVVHHKNGIKTDNRLENLQLETIFTHHFQHALDRWAKKHEQCTHCGTNTIPHQAKGYCSKCFKAQWYQSHKHVKSP